MKYYKHLSSILIAGLALSGCKSAQWAGKKIAKIETRQPAVLANYCGNLFPSIVYDSTRVIYKAGTPVISSDTVITRDTVSHVVYKYITKTLNTKDTVVTMQIRQTENKARIESLTMERDKSKTEGAVLTEKYQVLKKWAYILAAVSLIMIIWKIANWLKWLPI